MGSVGTLVALAAIGHGCKIRGVGLEQQAVKPHDGKDVLDGYVILYETQNGPVLAESEVFSSEEEAREAWVRLVHGL